MDTISNSGAPFDEHIIEGYNAPIVKKEHVKIEQLKVGIKVHYQSEHDLKIGEFQNGIIKEIPDHTDKAVRVVYHCAGEWDNFQNYTSQLTDIKDLYLDWK